MNENLAEMVKNTELENHTEPVLPSEEDLTQVVTEDIPLEVNTTEIQITNLFDWFKENSDSFENVHPVNVTIQDGDPTNLILSVENIESRKNEEGNIMRVIQGFENADNILILNLQALAMNIFKNNNFRILFLTPDQDIFIKCYSVNNGLITVYCSLFGDMLIPYLVKRVKRQDKTIELIPNENNNLNEKLNENADLEALQLLYKQSKKYIVQLSTNQTVVQWLLDRQKDVVDINHLLQIDNLIIDIMTS